MAIRGVRSFAEATSWDLNLKVGLAPGWQLGIAGTAYGRTPDGTGVGDLGLALKWRTDLSRAVAVAVVPGVTVPTGSAGLSAGRTLGAAVNTCVVIRAAIRLATPGRAFASWTMIGRPCLRAAR